jgi:hypothetical protein
VTDPRWVPSFFIAGAPKAGTSSMFRWISDHPDAFGSRDKETYFFVDPGTHMYRSHFHISNGLDSYRAQFPVPEGARPAIILEATPGYLYSETALAHIPGLSTRPRCLFILRDPAEQVYSLFSYFSKNWDWIPREMSFAEYLSAVEARSHAFKGNEIAQNALSLARYANFLERWRDRLGEDRMMVVTFDDLRSDHPGLTRRIATWLGLSPAFYDDYPFPRQNETYSARNHTLQSVNVVLRGLLPKGRSYSTLRSLYRRLNTRKPDGPDMGDAALINELRGRFAADNARLATEFDLDVAAWSQK